MASYLTCILFLHDEPMCIGCTISMCENGGTLDPSTCSCACLPEYTGVLCDSESFAPTLIGRLYTCTLIAASNIIVMFSVFYCTVVIL